MSRSFTFRRLALVAALAAGSATLLGACRAEVADAVVLPGTRAFPESVTSTREGTLYVGSLASGGVLRIEPGGGAPKVFVAPGADGTRSIFGVLADEAHGKLWVCSNDVSAIGVPGPGTAEGAWLEGFDLASGKLLVGARLPGAPALCNDIAIGPDGATYVTNSLAPVILRMKPGGDTLETWASDPRWEPPKGGGAGLDGIAFDRDGTLIVDLFNKAELYRVDVRGGRPEGIRQLAPNKRLKLADAIRPLDEGGFLLVEGSGSLDRLRVDGDKATVDVLRGGLDGPTGVARVGDRAWVAEGRLSHLQDAEIKQPFRLVPVPLPKMLDR